MNLAIAYAPALTGGAPANTVQTGSFIIGNLIQGKTWTQNIPQSSGGDTLFFASPPCNVNNAAPYIMAMPNPLKPPTGGLFEGLTQPQFFYSMTGGAFNLGNGAFTETCSYMLKNYKTDGSVGSPPADALGCTDVSTCQTKFAIAGWFQSYGFSAPA